MFGMVAMNDSFCLDPSFLMYLILLTHASLAPFLILYEIYSDCVLNSVLFVELGHLWIELDGEV